MNDKIFELIRAIQSDCTFIETGNARESEHISYVLDSFEKWIGEIREELKTIEFKEKS